MPRLRFSRLAALALLAATTAHAQPAAEVVRRDDAPPAPEWLQVRARYAVAIRSGTATGATTEATYSGVTPNDLALAAWAWPLLAGHLGFGLSVGREAFGLYEGEQRFVQAGLVRAGAGPTGRVRLGPASLEALVGYAFHQLPWLDATASDGRATAGRHAVLLAARASVDLGPLSLEGRFEYPLALAVTTSSAQAPSAQGLSAGGSVRVNLFAMGAMQWGLLGDVTWVSDSLSEAGGGTSTAQQVLRAGIGLDVRWRDEARKRSAAGSLRISVVDADSAAPLLAEVECTTGPERRSVTTDVGGVALVAALPPGLVTVRATAPGYESAEGGARVEADAEVTLSLRLKKEAPKVGRLTATVTEHGTGKALAGVALEVAGRSVVTDERGEAMVEGLSPGPVPVRLSADGYQPAEEAVSIAPGKTATLAVQLVPLKNVLPAIITGLVRSARGGKPVAALLELPEAGIKASANAKGAFTFEVPPGTYTVRISAPGYLTQTKRVTVREGDQNIFNVDLFPR